MQSAGRFQRAVRCQRFTVRREMQELQKFAECVNIKAMEFDKLAAFAKDNQIDLTVVGMDDPLVGGIVDVFEAEGLRVFGPRKNAAILEGSKAFQGFDEEVSYSDSGL